MHTLRHVLVKKEMHLIYLSFFIMMLARGMISLFVPVYFYQLGYSVSLIILYFLIASIAFVLFSLPAARIVSRMGVKHAILLSTPLLIIYYLLLKNIPDTKVLFFVLPAVLSAHTTLFNFAFHQNFLTHSSRARRGREVSFRGMAGDVATVSGPLIAGLIIATFGFIALFSTGAVLLIMGGGVLLLAFKTHETADINTKKIWQYVRDKANRGNILSFTGFAIESIISTVIWPVFLIIVLLRADTMGLVVTLSFIVSLATYYTIGTLTDRYDKSKLLKIATGLYCLAWLGRLLANSPLKVLIVDSYKNLAEKMLQVPWQAQMYDLADGKNSFVFFVTREIVYNLARVVMLPALMLLFFVDYHPFTLTFIIAALFTLLYPRLEKST